MLILFYESKKIFLKFESLCEMENLVFYLNTKAKIFIQIGVLIVLTVIMFSIHQFIKNYKIVCFIHKWDHDGYIIRIEWDYLAYFI